MPDYNYKVDQVSQVQILGLESLRIFTTPDSSKVCETPTPDS